MFRLPHHDGSETYVSTLEPELGEEVTVFVRASDVSRVQVRTAPNSEQQFVEAVVDRRDSGNGTWWRATVPIQNPVTNYRFLIEHDTGHRRWLTQAGIHDHGVPDATDFRLLTYDPPPTWSRDAVVYQIFPDRFARSARADDRPAPPWARLADWDAPPERGTPETPYQLYGGDLDGIASRLDHLSALGVNTVYVTPIFPARSSHRYDAAAFDHVDPVLGGDAALARLTDQIRRRGWRVIGDLTMNHCGDAHPWFQSAKSGAEAAARGMFYFDESGGYDAFWGVSSLPKFNWASAELRERFFDPAVGVITRWLRPPYSLDGWRVDVASMTGRRGADDFAHDVAVLTRAAASNTRADTLVVGEHTFDASPDLDRDGWHGTMNYAGFFNPVTAWLSSRAQVPADHFDLGELDGLQAMATMRAFNAHMSWRSLTASWNLLGSHDTARIRTVLGSADLADVAVGLLCTMPGVPMIFAGDELGLEGRDGDEARRPMPWHRPDTWDHRTLATYRALIALRTDQPALRRGGMRWLHADGGTLLFARETRDETIIVMARRAAGSVVSLRGIGNAPNVYGGAPDLHQDASGTTVMPADGPTFQVWRRAD